MALSVTLIINYILAATLLIGGGLAIWHSRRYSDVGRFSGDEKEMELLTRQFEYYLVANVVMLFGFIIYTFGAASGSPYLLEFTTFLGAFYVWVFVLTLAWKEVVER